MRRPRWGQIRRPRPSPRLIVSPTLRERRNVALAAHREAPPARKRGGRSGRIGSGPRRSSTTKRPRSIEGAQRFASIRRRGNTRRRLDYKALCGRSRFDLEAETIPPDRSPTCEHHRTMPVIQDGGTGPKPTVVGFSPIVTRHEPILRGSFDRRAEVALGGTRRTFLLR